MIFITGDVHHASLKTFDQRFLDRPEPLTALKWSGIIAGQGLRGTLFVTGRAADEDPQTLRRITDMGCIEIGGHTYNAFKNRRLHEFFKLSAGSFYGPLWYQRKDIQKTILSIKRATGKTITSWRSHAYRTDDLTRLALAEHAITHHSDRLDPAGLAESHNGLTHLPINTPEDHSHVIHGIRTPELVRQDALIKKQGVAGLLRSGSITNRRALRLALGREYRRLRGLGPAPNTTSEIWPVERWVREVLQAVNAGLERAGFAVIVAHPACMQAADGMEAFGKLCAELKSYETFTISQYPIQQAKG